MSDATSVELTPAIIAEWRQRAQSDELTTDEMRQWIAHVRGTRVSASIASATSRAKKVAPKISLDTMMDELDGIPDA